MTIWCLVFFQHFYRFDSLQNLKWGPALLRRPELCLSLTPLPSLILSWMCTFTVS